VRRFLPKNRDDTVILSEAKDLALSFINPMGS
jgi:hypothetical protein